MVGRLVGQLAKTAVTRINSSSLAEAVRFELTDGCPSLVFKTSALNHSATLPANSLPFFVGFAFFHIAS